MIDGFDPVVLGIDIEGGIILRAIPGREGDWIGPPAVSRSPFQKNGLPGTPKPAWEPCPPVRPSSSSSWIATPEGASTLS
ncbi:hypothetical protein QWZ10_17365 [Paracoccus cavernae]|uniref:ROK family protein n=1 Tax=Paracoccus cavernae TaxID=1571207 RepID=A0ABT8D9X6_9RHOB|nr:hypothetical protein [Paracoccus cavernae]